MKYKHPGCQKCKLISGMFFLRDLISGSVNKWDDEGKNNV